MSSSSLRSTISAGNERSALATKGNELRRATLTLVPISGVHGGGREVAVKERRQVTRRGG